MTNLANPARAPDVQVPGGGANGTDLAAPAPGSALPPPTGSPFGAAPVVQAAAPTVPAPEAESAASAPAAARPEMPQFQPIVPAAEAKPSFQPEVATQAAPATAGIPSFNDFTATPTTHKHKRKQRGGGFGRFLRTLFVLALLGGLIAGGIVYGPELWEKVQEESSDAPPAPDEPEAPLRFPVATAAPLEVRNATFVLDDLDPEGDTRRYEITTDFETKASRVVIDRAELPTLEVITFLDQAVVRRMDDDVWYRTARGRFPLDDQLERDRWVRHLDELIPMTNRAGVEIQQATTSQVAGERMQRIVVSIDPALLGGPTIATGMFGDPSSIDEDVVAENVATSATPATGDAADPDAVATTDAAVATDVASDATTRDAVGVGADQVIVEPIDPSAAPPPDEPKVLEKRPVGTAVPVGTTAASPVSLELWIDAHGLIRQLVSPEVLGGETLTVTQVSPDAWLPDFPLEEQVQPLTASALVELGL